MNIKTLVLGAAAVSLVVVGGGCSSITRGAPSASTTIQANMNSGDCQILASTEGKSTKTSVLGGVFQVIDGDKYRILWIKFFEDQYAFSDTPRGYFSPVSVQDRAYFKALAATPDADVVARKAYIDSESGIPFLWHTEEVTFQGKALKFKGGN